LSNQQKPGATVNKWNRRNVATNVDIKETSDGGI
jgi:hypothetical protein